MGLASAYVSVLADITLPISQSLLKGQETSACHQKIWCFSLYGVLTNAAQLHNVRQPKTCVSLAKTLSSHVLLWACFSRTSSTLWLLQQNITSHVCLRKRGSNWLAKEPLSFHFTFVFSPLWRRSRAKLVNGNKHSGTSRRNEFQCSLQENGYNSQKYFYILKYSKEFYDLNQKKW